MKKLSLLYAVLIIVVSGYYFYSCEEAEDVVNITAQVFDNEATAIKQITEIQSVCSDAASYIIMLSSGQNINQAGCPNVSTDTVAKKITVDFGNTPCTPYSEGVKRSGGYTVNYYINSSGDSLAGIINYNNYKVFKSTTDTAYIKISGNDYLGIKKKTLTDYDLTIIANNTSDFSDGRTGSVTLNQIVSVIINNITVFTDDVYKIYGTGMVTANGDTFGYSIYDQNNRLEYYGDCYYPKKGLVKLNLNGTDFDVDFQPENAACDAIISITKFGVTAKIDFSKF
ncbi:MAG: hypothetical protein MUE56_06810 [Ignavibacteria bacterium]|jgi:hypothetical protein|nr:hypothetical protein [Ignavibacteria bacterium]